MTGRAANGQQTGAPERLLRALRGAGTLHAGWEELGRALSLTRAELERAARSLADLGYEIDQHPARGLQLAGVPDLLLPDEIEAELEGPRFRGPVHCFGVVGSTNTVALRLGRAGAPEGTLVSAESQTAGRGRYHRRWHSPPRQGLWFSLVLRPGTPALVSASLSILASLALADALRARSVGGVKVKWPNDLMIEGCKAAGILAELAADGGGAPFVVLGVGLNVNQSAADFPAELAGRAASLRTATGRDHPRVTVLGQLLRALEARYERFLRGGLGPMVGEWNALALWLGEPVEVRVGRAVRSGVLAGLADTGGLLLRTPAGVQEVVMAGDLRRAAPRGAISPGGA